MKTSNLLHTAIWAASLQLLLGFPTHCAATGQQENSAVSSAYEHLPEWLHQTFHQHSPVPTYVERFQGLSRMFSQARDLTSLDEEQRHRFQLQLHDAVTDLLSLSPEAVREAVLRSVEGLPSRGPGDVRNGSAGGLEAVEYTVSELCLNHTVAIVKGLIEKDYWAIQLLDATGKLPAGLTIGGTRWIGNYDQCLKVRAYTDVKSQPRFAGQYCRAMLYVKPSRTFPINKIDIDICIPDTCNMMDMNILLNDVLVRLQRPERVGVYCLTDDRSLNTRAIVAIVICSVILACMVLGTLLDVLYVQMPQWKEETKIHTTDITTNGHSVEVVVDETMPLVAQKIATKTSGAPSVKEIGIVTKVFLTFSVYTNGSKLLSTNQPPGSLTCVHGIRFLSMTWVVLGHAYIFLPSFSGNAGLFTMEAISRWTFQTVSNATLSVDSFFVLSGLLVAYLSLKEMKKKSGKLNWFLFYFHRFWRLTPAYMLVIMVDTCLSPYWGKGPFWPGTDFKSNCVDNWWTNLLYVNNLVKPKEMCLGQSWYLANDMQFYILSPLIFVPFYFSPLLGCVSSGLFILATAIAPGVIDSKEYFPPASFVQIEGNHKQTEDYFSYFYIKPWNRMGPYVIGLMAGYFLYSNDCKLRINKFLNLFLWAVAAGAAIGVLYGLYEACNGHPLTVEVAAFYSAVNRQVWAACVAWVVIACVTGNGGFVNTLLSWSGLVPLSRLTYCIYLLHIMIMDIYILNQQTTFYLTDVNVVMFFLSALVVSYMAAFIASLAFEAPMMGLEKMLFRRDERRSESEEKLSKDTTGGKVRQRQKDSQI